MRSSSDMGAFGLLGVEVVGTSVHAKTVSKRELYLVCCSVVSVGGGGGFETSRGSVNGVLTGSEIAAVEADVELAPFMVVVTVLEGGKWDCPEVCGKQCAKLLRECSNTLSCCASSVSSRAHQTLYGE